VQEPSRSLAIVLRTATDPSSLAPALEGIVRELDKDLPLFQTRTMDQMLGASIARERMSMLVFVVFAVVALTLASVGLYGVVSHGVTERTHEIGVRMALGAEQRHVVGLVVRQGLSMAALGTAIGVAGDRPDDTSRSRRDAVVRRTRRMLRAGLASDSCESDYGTAIRIDRIDLIADCRFLIAD
jgi:hypothetical protein